jgi:hypothetical protein
MLRCLAISLLPPRQAAAPAQRSPLRRLSRSRDLGKYPELERLLTRGLHPKHASNALRRRARPYGVEFR